MLSIVSSITGQTLFTLELRNGVATLSPDQTRRVLEALGSSPIGYHVDVTQSGSGTPVPCACMLGVAATSHEGVARDRDREVVRSTGQTTKLNATQGY